MGAREGASKLALWGAGNKRPASNPTLHLHQCLIIAACLVALKHQRGQGLYPLGLQVYTDGGFAVRYGRVAARLCIATEFILQSYRLGFKRSCRHMYDKLRYVSLECARLVAASQCLCLARGIRTN